MAKALGRRRVNAAMASIISALLDEARQAYPRIRQPHEPEGLHDFRVALRRLRSLLKDFRSQPGVAVDKELYRQLTALARATNDARDSEVMLAWLDEQVATSGAAERGALGWWRERLAPQVDREYARLDAPIASFPMLDAKLREAANRARGKRAALGSSAKRKSTRKQDVREAPRFGVASAEVLERLRDQWLAELAQVRVGAEEEALHRPRITGKRLRYLLKPWREQGSAFVELEEEMKRFQDAFGDLHDDLVRADALTAAALRHAEDETLERLASAVTDAPLRASAPRHLRGFMLLHGRQQEQTEVHLTRVMTLCRKPQLERLATKLEEAAQQMRASS
ncbi:MULTISPECIES: CHAD domain-containing protein [unclassified Halomonas]|uniref:CHAD domain-containing protein n=1 Tax=unclassified Halomonas TaxID=2609666 RepID=UPI001C938147|nr:MULTISPECIES: CHAD domain-containing protein [unclassified Halomonas]MBY5925703.1 CHAD domain-containing protein [Halomonas sp. DP4Y7-2]MBY6232478.1 CHAD domain-containing protein [Halomonas sp. DP4Y7-1]